MKFPIGMVHGRFQPFHNEHLRYLQMAMEQSERLLIGLTNPDPSQTASDDRSLHRHTAEANPFTYYERQEMIARSLLSAGIRCEIFRCVPFPINFPERWRYYCPDSTVHFIRVFSDWEAGKAAALRASGYAVVELPHDGKRVSGSEVRALIASGGAWEKLVPNSAVDVIKRAVAGSR